MAKYSIIWNEQVMKSGGKNKVHIYIPVNIEKIIVSSSIPKENNYFEKLVLRLFYKKGRTIEEVAQILQLDPAFVKKIFDKLKANELIDRHLIITDKGKNLVSTGDSEDNKEVMYIFYDLIGKFYWNIIVNEQEYKNFKREISALDTREYPRLNSNNKYQYQSVNIGPAGDSRTIKLRYLPIASSETEKTKKATPFEVSNIVSQHRKILMDAQRENFDVSQEYFKVIPRKSVENRSMGLVETVFIGTVIYIPEEIAGANDWEVLNPFGFGNSTEYRWVLENRFGKRADNVGESEMFEEWITELRRGYSANEGEKISFQIQDSVIREIYTLGLDDYPGLMLKVKNVLKFYGEILLSEKGGDQGVKWQSDAEKYIKEMVLALEEALKIAEEKEIAETSQQKFNGDVNLKMEIKAERLGFIIPENSYLFRLKNSNLENGFGLFSLVGRNLLLETEGIVRVSRNSREFLQFVSQLKELRDKSEHDDEDYLNEEILGYITLFLERIGDLLGIACKCKNINKYFSDSKMRKNLEKKNDLYAICLAEWRNRGYNSNLTRYLTELDFYERCVRQEIGEPQTSSVVVNIAKIYEALLSKIKMEVFKNESIEYIEEDKEKNLEILENVIRTYGFDLDKERFREKFLTVSTDKIKKSYYNFKMSVLSCKLYTILFSLVENEDNKFMKKLATQIPDFIDFGIEIDRERGHGDREIDNKLVSILKKKIEDIVEKINKI